MACAAGIVVLAMIEAGNALLAPLCAPTDRDWRALAATVRAGFRPGDLIVAAEGQPMSSNDSLQRVLSGKRAGDTLTLTVYRGGRKVDVKVKLGEAPRQL